MIRELTMPATSCARFRCRGRCTRLIWPGGMRKIRKALAADLELDSLGEG